MTASNIYIQTSNLIFNLASKLVYDLVYNFGRYLNHFLRYLICVLAFIATSACATNMKEKVLRNALIAGAIGYAIGQQRQDSQVAYGSMYAGNFAAAAALASVYYYDPDKEIEDARKKSRELVKSMDDFASGSQTSLAYSSPRGLSAGPALNNVHTLPEKYRKLISQGEWTLKQIDEWEQIDEYRKVHKTEMLELIPATFNQ